ncbi:MAG: glycoside hydrolase family 73 protein [Ignavibacteriaceae bacterium]
MSPSDVKSFLQCFYETAKSAGAISGLSPLFILAVSALETGFGKYAPGNNFFGIKANRGWKGKRIVAFTREFVPEEGGKYVRVKGSFRAYTSFEESCRDFCRLIRRRYPQCVGVMDESVCTLIQSNPEFRYSTSPEYGKRLTDVYRRISELIVNG